MLLFLPKFKAELINAIIPNSKNERRILIGYWLAQQLIAVRDVQVMCCTCIGWTLTSVQCTMCVCMHCAMLCGVKRGQTGSKLRSCDWPSFKMNRPHLAYDFPLEFQWENKETHKLSVTEGSRLLFDFERVRGRNAQPSPPLSC